MHLGWKESVHYFVSNVLTALSLTITGVFVGTLTPSGSSPPKDKVTLKKVLNMPADALKRLAGKTTEALPLSWEVLLVLFLIF